MKAEIKLVKKDLAQYGEKYSIEVTAFHDFKYNADIPEHDFNFLVKKYFPDQKPKRSPEVAYWTETYE